MSQVTERHLSQVAELQHTVQNQQQMIDELKRRYDQILTQVTTGRQTNNEQGPDRANNEQNLDRGGGST